MYFAVTAVLFSKHQQLSMMEKTFEQLTSEIVETISDRLGVDNTININDNLINDLGADSLDTVELIMDIERKYDVHLSDDETSEIKTVRDIVTHVYNAINQK